MGVLKAGPARRFDEDAPSTYRMWWEWVWLLPSLAFGVVWTIDRIGAYFWKDEMQGWVGFVDAVLPDNANPDVSRQFFAKAIRPMYNEHVLSNQVHVISGSILGFLLALQLMSPFRNRFLVIHRLLGGLTVLLLFFVAIHSGYILFIRGMVDMGWHIQLADKTQTVIVVIGTLFGLRAIKAGDVVNHRRCMMVVAANCYVIPTQRFFMSIFSKANAFGGPYESWQQWIDGPVAASAICGFFLPNMLALVYGFVVAPSVSDMKYHKIGRGPKSGPNSTPATASSGASSAGAAQRRTPGTKSVVM